MDDKLMKMARDAEHDIQFSGECPTDVHLTVLLRSIAKSLAVIAQTRVRSLELQERMMELDFPHPEADERAPVPDAPTTMAITINGLFIPVPKSQWSFEELVVICYDGANLIPPVPHSITYRGALNNDGSGSISGSLEPGYSILVQDGTAFTITPVVVEHKAEDQEVEAPRAGFVFVNKKRHAWGADSIRFDEVASMGGLHGDDPPPTIEYSWSVREPDHGGVLLPGETIPVRDGTEFTVTANA